MTTDFDHRAEYSRPARSVHDLSVDPSVIELLTADEQEKLAEVLDEYLRALETGMPLSPDQLMAAHPKLAEPLRVYLVQLDKLHGLAAGFGDGQTFTTDERPASVAAMQLGDFLLGQEIGRGGMGVVYDAQQISLGRRVALKVLPFAAVLDGKQIARFHNEAQMAAQLHHPNIVPVYAVGVERGVHYYAMQLIDGQPLDRALAQLRQQHAPVEPGLDQSRVASTQAGTVAEQAARPQQASQAARSYLSDRATSRQHYITTILRLGIQAASALHAAHEYGVVHRDIKPSNLLLDGHGKLWVTDFGLARFRNDHSLTRSGDILGTLRYMSPEQASGNNSLVDHRTDIYSLAVTLYEMLALQPVLQGGATATLLREIEQTEPPRLRKVRPDIPRDLETVIRRAMAKQREDRYATAADFGNDLQRVLDGKPTVARPPRLHERIAKWGRRHQRTVGAALAVALIGVVGLAASTVLIARKSLEAEQNYQRAEKNFRAAQEAVDRFGAQLAQRLADVPGAAKVRSQLLDETLGYYQLFIQQASGDPALNADIALTYSKIGKLREEIGSVAGAVEAHEMARAWYCDLLTQHPDNLDYQRQLALCENNLGLAYSHAGKVDQARDMYLSAIDRQRRLAGTASGERYLDDLALTYSNLGLLQSDAGARPEALQSLQEAIRLRQQAGRVDRPAQLRGLAAAYANLGGVLTPDELPEAIKAYQQALELQRQAVQLAPQDLQLQSDLALTLNNLGVAYARQKDYTQSADIYGQVVKIQRHLVEAAPAFKTHRHDLAVTMNNYGLVLCELRRLPDAEAAFRRALESQQVLVAQYPDELGLQSRLGGMYNNLGIALEEQERLEEAAEAYQQAVKYQYDVFSRAPRLAGSRLFLSKHYFNYGRALRHINRPDLAAQAALARRALWPGSQEHLLEVAEEFALAASQLQERQDGTLGEWTAQACQDEVIETLRQAAAGGLLPADTADKPAFEGIRLDPRFTCIVSTSESQQ